MPTPLHERPGSFYSTFARKDGDPSVTHYCPGCGHGNLHKFIAETIDDLGIADRVILINPVGCSVFAHYYLDVGHIQAAHGRAPAVATGVKRARPDGVVIVYQGDGDLAAIGGNQIVQAASRGENLTVIFINNAIYGMTGGQMAPTSLLGQVTTTTPEGRSAARDGHPLRVCELLAALEAPAYLARVALGDARNDLLARTAVRKAIRNQVEGRGFSLVEVLSPCPIGWRMTPPEAARFVLDRMAGTFPPGVLRDRATAPAGGRVGGRTEVPPERIPEILGLRPGDGGSAPLDADGFATKPIEACYRNQRIKAAGFGGQGVLFLGSLIAEAGMLAGRGVSWLPSYGPQMRGGTAHCHVILSDRPVDSPLVTRSTVLFALNGPSLERFGAEVAEGGLVIYDSTLVHSPPPLPGREVIAIPATTIAERIGSERAANIVVLGAWLSRTRSLPTTAIETALRRLHLKAGMIDLDLSALEAGSQFQP